MRRELPFGDHHRGGKRALDKIDDPFFRFWFRVVAAHRGLLIVSLARARRELWRRHASHIHAETWEDLARQAVPLLGRRKLGAHAPFGGAARYWRAAQPEWEVVAESGDGKALLLGEAWHEAPADERFLDPAT